MAYTGVLMIRGVGVDIIEIERIKESVEKYGQNFLERIFTPKEIAYCSVGSSYKFSALAVRFSAKEAYSKALGTGIGRILWKDIEVINNKVGQPHIYVKGQKAEGAYVSLSHSHKNAIAMVVIEEPA